MVRGRTSFKLLFNAVCPHKLDPRCTMFLVTARLTRALTLVHITSCFHSDPHELNKSVQIAEARTTDAERQAQATLQELSRSQQAGAKGKGKGATPPKKEQGIGAVA